jgi:trafficking protein particle complex subunit 8
MTSSPLSTNSSSGVLPNFRTSSPIPQILRSAAASSTSSLSSLFQYASSNVDYPSLLDEAHVHHATIAQAFCPTVAVVSSKECDELLRAKGFTGLLDMLRPFGDCVQGKVNIRDSQAMSIPVEDFSVRFVDFHHYARGIANGTSASRDQGPYAPKSPTMQTYVPGGDLVAIERLLETKIESSEKKYEQATAKGEVGGSDYSFFLRKMLSATPVSAHETFSHPVACILAVSSHHPEPVDALLGLYNTTNNAPIPRYIDAGFLRYYVLIHDEDKDDFEK